MTTPVSAATPASAMKPTATATLMLNCIQAISQTPPSLSGGRRPAREQSSAPPPTRQLGNRRTGFEDQRSGRVGGRPVIGQPKPDDPRQDRRLRASHDNIADTASAERAGSAQRVG